MVDRTVSIDDSSSFINYSPHGDGGVGDWTATGWQPYYSDQGFNKAAGQFASGESSHITALSGAKLDFQFFGTAVSLYGAANCTYEVAIDGDDTLQQPTEGQLFHKTGLAEQMHNVILTVHPQNGELFSFDRAEITRPLGDGEDNPKPITYQATDTNFIKYNGNWTQKMDPNGQIPSKEHPGPFYVAANAPASLSFDFQGSAVAINGSRIWGGWTYTVDVDGTTTAYNGSTMWLIGDALLFYQDGLNPSTNHTLTLKPTVGDGFKFWLNSVTVYGSANDDDITGMPGSASSPSSSSRLGPGAIVGLIMGIAVFLAIIAVAIALYLRRRRAAATRDAPMTPYTDPDSDSEINSGILIPYPMAQTGGAPLSSSSVSVNASYSAPPPKLALERQYAMGGTQAGSATRPTAPNSLVASAPASGPTYPAASSVDSSSSVSASSVPPMQPGSADADVAIDRLVQIIVDRIDTVQASRSTNYSSGFGDVHPDHPPPEYSA